MESPSAPPSIESTWGMLLLGMGLALFLTGVATVQTWNFFRNFPQDPTAVKILVIAVYCADTFHTALLIDTAYHYLVLNFGVYSAFEDLEWSLLLSILLNGLIAWIVQTYYCTRVLRVTKSRVIAGCCWALSTVRFVFTVAEAVTLFQSGRTVALASHQFKWQITTTLTVGAASDLAIAAFICGGLLHMRTGFKATDRLLDKLVTFTIGSGLLTSVAAVIECILYLVFPMGFAFVIPYSITAKLFNNSLLANLNEREANRKAVQAAGVKTQSVQSQVQSRSEDIELALPHERKLTHSVYREGISAKFYHIGPNGEEYDRDGQL